MNKYIGTKFTDGANNCEVLDIITIRNEEYLRYKNFTQDRQDQLYTKEQFENIINNQFELHCRYIKNINYNKKAELRRLEEQKREEEEKAQYNFCYGYTDNKTDLQKGKILKILNELIKYEGNIFTKKDYIEYLLKNKYNCYTREFFNTHRYSQKKVNGCYKKLVDKQEYRLYYTEENEEYFTDLNKIMFDYTNYLIDNSKIG